MAKHFPYGLSHRGCIFVYDPEVGPNTDSVAVIAAAYSTSPIYWHFTA